MHDLDTDHDAPPACMDGLEIAVLCIWAFGLGVFVGFKFF